MNRLLLASLTGLALLLIPLAAAANDVAELKKSIRADFDAWQFERARETLEELEASAPKDPGAVYLKGELAFYDGDYEESLELIDQAMAMAGDSGERFSSLRDVVASTLDVTRDYETIVSEDGRFQISFEKGKDKVLAEWAFDAMGSAYDAFAHDFGVDIPTPIRIEVYPSATDLARVSTLTEEDIQTSGTIALCKYNRLMLTSPRALTRGYTWLDTLVHEYAHMVINHAGGGNVPIWLHEGLAKYSERRWRGGDEVRRLPPYSEWLLEKRATEGNIVTFEQMHPSMAKLPSQEDASMAFAEVYAAIEMLHSTHGIDGLQSMLKQISGGVAVKDAVAIIHGDSWTGFISDWEEHLTSRNRRYTGKEPPDIFEQIAFKKDVSVDQDDDLEEIPEDKAREYVHLEDLLYSKDRFNAAAVLYRKATGIVGETNPVLQVRVGRTLLQDDQPAAAAKALKKAVEDGETYVTLYVYLGAALVKLERYNEAYLWLREAAAVNPFDPTIHRNLAVVYKNLGQSEKAKTAKEHARLVVE